LFASAVSQTSWLYSAFAGGFAGCIVGCLAVSPFLALRGQTSAGGLTKAANGLLQRPSCQVRQGKGHRAGAEEPKSTPKSTSNLNARPRAPSRRCWQGSRARSGSWTYANIAQAPQAPPPVVYSGYFRPRLHHRATTPAGMTGLELSRLLPGLPYHPFASSHRFIPGGSSQVGRYTAPHGGSFHGRGGHAGGGHSGRR
jgi:hypothetical protein